MNLLIEYFKSKNAERDREYLFCINQNLQNPLINKIFIFISDDSTFENVSEKITIVNQENRPTFYDLMKYCNLNLILVNFRINLSLPLVKQRWWGYNQVLCFRFISFNS
jgi:hypothetical protein